MSLAYPNCSATKRSRTSRALATILAREEKDLLNLQRRQVVDRMVPPPMRHLAAEPLVRPRHEVALDVLQRVLRLRLVQHREVARRLLLLLLVVVAVGMLPGRGGAGVRVAPVPLLALPQRRALASRPPHRRPHPRR